MTLLTSEIVDFFYTFLWPMVRISAFLLVAPIFSISVVNIRIRVVIAFFLTLTVYPLHQWQNINPISSFGLSAFFFEAIIGLLMGLIAQVVVAAVVVAGQSIANAVGLGMANMMDPNLGNVPVISQFFIIISTLVFLLNSGHLILTGLLLETFNYFPVGSSINVGDLYGKFIPWSSMIFLGALLIAIPVMVAMLFLNIGVGIITRAAPSLNIFAIGFPAFLFGGFLFLLISIPVITNRIEWIWLRSFIIIRNIYGIG
jgi:flagellar biosynthetic protein FliR